MCASETQMNLEEMSVSLNAVQIAVKEKQPCRANSLPSAFAFNILGIKLTMFAGCENARIS